MDYSDPKAWDSRYSNDLSPYEWFADWPLIKSVVREYISHKCNILHIGCGTSNLGDHLISDGYKEVVNIDASETVIQSRTNSKHCTYQRVDVRQMDVFATSEFDAIIDKGTIDSLMCSAKATHESGEALSEIFRVLKPGGVFLCFSHAAPPKRMGMLGRPALKWSVTYVEIPRSIPVEKATAVPPPLYCYACRKSGL